VSSAVNTLGFINMWTVDDTASGRSDITSCSLMPDQIYASRVAAFLPHPVVFNTQQVWFSHQQRTYHLCDHEAVLEVVKWNFIVRPVDGKQEVCQHRQLADHSNLSLGKSH